MTLETNEISLRGATVVVTRAADDAAELIQVLEARGAAVLRLPLIAFEPPGDGGIALSSAAAGARRGDVVAVTSARGATALIAACPDGPGDGVVVAAVGRATAAALWGTGWRAGTVPDVQTAAALATEIGSPGPDGRIVHVAAAKPRPELAASLRSMGWDVDQVEAYRTRLIKPEREAVLEASMADLITFTSGSTVRGWIGVAGGATTPMVVTLGPPTTSTATELGVAVTAEATEHNVTGLVDAVALAWSSQAR